MKSVAWLATLPLALSPVLADSSSEAVPQSVIEEQRRNLASNTEGQGVGPQSPRDIDSAVGNNSRAFGTAPPYQQMNLCNIHFHKGAEHKGGEYTEFAGPGDGAGYQSGYRFSGDLTEQERSPLAEPQCPSDHGSLMVGDTIEVHYVFSSAQVTPGPTLGSCLNDAIGNPQLRVEAVVMVLVNDPTADDFMALTALDKVNGYHQAPKLPENAGKAVNYAGSTTGPDYNEKASPLQVSWAVRPKALRVHAPTVGQWCQGNVFEEDHAHGVRNLVVNPNLLSPIQ
ncbi:delta-class carbonic anhydrase [Ferrimonas marina]|uniref:Cadmium carbonic anhydrase repeat-containing protein n=1 Tax=Ferrimonas marina TaxID=299255 RepID=A0A1M5Z5J9_9GAMM|nr:delta-class carbonic anhydrase [Ferrimonas marina]SHI19499.1 hypothetical protein SAMN02745129_4691 [Ferrimonas marina]